LWGRDKPPAQAAQAAVVFVWCGRLNRQRRRASSTFSTSLRRSSNSANGVRIVAPSTIPDPHQT
jgi:hypothetical protein